MSVSFDFRPSRSASTPVPLDSPPNNAKTCRSLLVVPAGLLLKVVPYAIGTLLIVSASFKTVQVLSGDQIPQGFLSLRWIRTIVIQAEVLCGLALILGVYWRIARRLCQVIFGLFLIGALYQSLLGAQSCGCFGSMTVRPIAIFFLDLFVLTLLWFWHPANPELENRIAKAGFLPCVVVGCLLPFGLFLVDQPSQSSIEVYPDILRFGPVLQGEKHKSKVVFRNLSAARIHIARFDFSCSCAAVEPLKIDLDPDVNTPTILWLDLAKEPAFTGHLQIEVTGWTASGERVLFFLVDAHVVPPTHPFANRFAVERPNQ